MHRSLHYFVWQTPTSIAINIPEMALKTSATPYIALLSLIVSVIPGLFWLYQKMVRPKKRGKNDRQEIRSSITPMYHNAQELSPTYFYLEETRCRQAWILRQDVLANTPCHISPTSLPLPSHSVAASNHGSQVVSLGTSYSIHISTRKRADQLHCRVTTICGMSEMLLRPLYYRLNCR